MKTTAKTFLLSFFLLFIMLISCGNSIENDEKSGTLVILETDYGNMTIKLYDETPIHRDNFIKLAKEGFYDGVLFHRVIENFMIQTGDPESIDSEPGEPLGRGGPSYTLEAEIKPELLHKKGAVAAARQGDQVNPEKRSSGSQFYIVQGRVFSHQELDAFANQTGKSLTPEQQKIYTEIGGVPQLDNDYTVFGEVVDSMEIIDQIASVETNRQNRPLENIKINKVVVKE